MKPRLQGPRVAEARRLLESQREKAWIPLILRHGKTFYYQGALATCEPTLVETLLMQRVHTRRRSVVYKIMSRLVPGAPGVLFMDGDEWQQHVHAVMPVFTRAQVDAYAQTIHELAVSHTSCWQHSQHLSDLMTAVTELGVKVILRCGYGLDPNSTLGAQLGRELIDYKFDTMTTKHRLDTFGYSPGQLAALMAFFGDRRRLRSRMKRIETIIHAIVDERQASGYQGVDWIQQLQGAGFPLPQIADELNHIYGAFNAIDFTITCALYELSKRPEWHDIIRQELIQTLGGRAYPTREDFDALPNTINFMKEIFRHYPVAITVGRRTGAPIQADGLTIPAGQEVVILLYALHHHPDYWDDPTTFDPDRWKTSPMPRIPFTYVPFLTGPRQCIGRHLAELHFVVILNALLQRHRFEVLDHSVQLTPYLIPRFDRSMPCIVHCT
jgi:cytochrome P450